MICDKCNNIAILNSFNETNCIMCGEIMTSPHYPPFKVCEDCSIDLNVCRQCGRDMKEE